MTGDRRDYGGRGQVKAKKPSRASARKDVKDAAATAGSPAPAAAAGTSESRAALREHTSLWSRSGFLVRRLHQIHVAMFMEELAEDRITPIQYGLLSILVDMPGLDQFSVAEELGIDRANVADVLKRLEARRLVVRIVDPDNKRRKICLATRAGAKFVEKYKSRMQRAQNRLLEPLTPDERRCFMDMLYKLIDANNVYGRTTLRMPATRPGAAAGPGRDEN